MHENLFTSIFRCQEYFVTSCKINESERSSLYAKVTAVVPNFYNLCDEFKFLYLMTNEDKRVLIWFGKYLHESFLIRSLKK